MSGTSANYQSEIFRKNHPIILAARRDLASIKPINLYKDGDDYLAGQVLARDSGDGLYKRFSSVSGSMDAACILFEDVSDDSFAGVVSGNQTVRGVFGGEVFESKCVDLDSGAKSDLGGRSIVDALGTTIFKF